MPQIDLLKAYTTSAGILLRRWNLGFIQVTRLILGGIFTGIGSVFVMDYAWLNAGLCIVPGLFLIWRALKTPGSLLQTFTGGRFEIPEFVKSGHYQMDVRHLYEGPEAEARIARLSAAELARVQAAVECDHGHAPEDCLECTPIL